MCYELYLMTNIVCLICKMKLAFIATLSKKLLHDVRGITYITKFNYNPQLKCKNVWLITTNLLERMT